MNDDPAARAPAGAPPPAPHRPGSFAPIALGLAITLLIAVVIQRARRDDGGDAGDAQASAPRGDVLAVWGPVPDAGLRDRFGRRFGFDQLAGRIAVVNFFFTTCPGPCIPLTRKVRTLAERFRGEERVEFVSVSVDALADTDDQLTAFARSQGGEMARWHWLGGSEEAIAATCAAFLAAYDGRKDESGDMRHSTRLHVVDPQGRIRAIHDTASDEGWLEATTHSIRLLLAGDALPPAEAGERP